MMAFAWLKLSGPDRLEAGRQGWLCLNGGRFWLRHGRGEVLQHQVLLQPLGMGGTMRDSRVDHLDPFRTIHDIHENSLIQFGISAYLITLYDFS